MTTLFDRIKEEVSNPYLLDDTEIHNLFTKFYDEIDTMKEREGVNVDQLELIKITYIIPMLMDNEVISEYKEKAYKTKEREFYENKREEEDEMNYAFENGMESEYWCDACKYGDCHQH